MAELTIPLITAPRPAGLTTVEVHDRRARGLANGVPQNTGRSLARILAANVFTVFNGIVGGSFVLLLVLGAWQDAVFGFFVLANTGIGVVQEYRAKRTLARLNVLNAPRVLVRRDDAESECAVAEVVLGDILVLRPGEQVSADAVLIEARELEIDESLLTGEADPVSSPVGRELLSGSTVAAGSGLARTIRVGGDSYASRITAEARQFDLVDSELRRSIGRIIRWLSILLVPIGAIVVNGQMQAAGGWSSVLADGTWREAGVTSVASIVAMVPAGLVFMTSLALAMGAVKLARGRVLTRELSAVEVLARVDMLCIDKTGTLTEGSVSLDRVEPVDRPAAGWKHALASLAADPVANATSQAIVASFHDTRAAADTVVAFSSRHKWSGVHFTGGASPGSWVLGGADVVLAGAIFDGSRAGERTLVLAHSPHEIPEPGGEHHPLLPAGLELVAVLVFGERVRSDAAATLRYFSQQGVEVCVLSGDDPHTVAAVALAVGLPVAERSVDARDLPTASAELAEILRTERVFGRVTPEQKRAMVIALQSSGHTVAMIGDGVNDTLALKHADLGIAMGSGSAAARAVADLVLLDGDLAQLPLVVAEGRQVIANVERLARLFLSKTVYALVLAVAFGLLLWPFPFLPRQLSIADGLTIGLPALVLALQPSSRRYEPGFLRRALRFCVPCGLVIAAAVVITVALVAEGGATPTAHVQTAAMIVLALSALWVLVVLARPFTRSTAAVVALAYAGLVVLLVVPLTRDFLQLQLPTPEALAVTLAVAGVACVLVELVYRVGAHGARVHR
ncbi:MAG: HAD-IC family P-type ATPase [Pseudolysinimonas sp.]